MTVPAEVDRSVTAQGRYAGFVSRFVAFVIDAYARRILGVH